MESSFSKLKKTIQPCGGSLPTYRYYIDFYNWCKEIFDQTDFIKTRLQFHILEYDDNHTSALLFIMKNMISIREILKTLPDYKNELERKFVIESVSAILSFLEKEFDERDPLLNIAGTDEAPEEAADEDACTNSNTGLRHQ